ncbi:MAG: hypothetical protein U1F71_15220 [Verrucomicrobiaceae bacterium]
MTPAVPAWTLNSMVTGPDNLRKVRFNQRRLSYLELLAQMERNHPQNALRYAEFRRRHLRDPQETPGSISLAELIASGLPS